MKRLEDIVKAHEIKKRNKLLDKGHMFSLIMDSDNTWIDKSVILHCVFDLNLIQCKKFQDLWKTKKEDETFMEIYFKVAT